RDREQHQRLHEAPQLAGHQQEPVALRARPVDHGQVHENARQVEQAGEPARHEDDVEGLDPEVAGTQGDQLRTWPSPNTTYFSEVRPSRPTGPRACSLSVEMPISAPRPNSKPSANRVDALIMTEAASTSRRKR